MGSRRVPVGSRWLLSSSRIAVLKDVHDLNDAIDCLGILDETAYSCRVWCFYSRKTRDLHVALFVLQQIERPRGGIQKVAYDFVVDFLNRLASQLRLSGTHQERYVYGVLIWVDLVVETSGEQRH